MKLDGVVVARKYRERPTPREKRPYQIGYTGSNGLSHGKNNEDGNGELKYTLLIGTTKQPEVEDNPITSSKL